MALARQDVVWFRVHIKQPKLGVTSASLLSYSNLDTGLINAPPHSSAWGFGGWRERVIFRIVLRGKMYVEDGGVDRPEGNTPKFSHPVKYHHDSGRPPGTYGSNLVWEMLTVVTN